MATVISDRPVPAKTAALLQIEMRGPLENVAVNLRALGRKVSEIANYDRLQGRLSQLELDWQAKFGSDDWEIAKEKAHVASEKLRLEAAIAIFGERNASLNLLADSIAIVQSCLNRPELEGWLGAITAEQIKEHVSQFRALQIDALREGKLDASSTAFTKSIHCIADELAKAAMRLIRSENLRFT
ncbi:hypothetical protein [Bradyrhizobium diazoefficiens]|uniref:hypothetical protein n=1 Tax=Bradyrhizobium diazoefficiens TaxID=1355477 RepID=UPI00272C006E|nr:hypothetical protein [Bradyrhizobium diazoefficiens]WLA65440.1 hypothetical protein QNN01_00605 [Bradyrhizobium diazoefficiens]